MSDSMVVVENLRTAIEGKMDAAAVGILQGILVAIEAGSGEYLENKEESNELLGSKDKDSAFVEDAGDRQRALYKANICPTLTTLLRELGKNVNSS